MSETYISILRGINVSGQRIIKMEGLRLLYLGLGFKNVQTYIQSGNVIFQAERFDKRQLETEICDKIKELFHFDVPVLVMDLGGLKKIVKNNPFLNDPTMDIKSQHVTFLSDKPLQENLEKIQSGQYAPDEFVVIDQVAYIYCPIGYGNTKLNNNFFENKLKVNATTRNWKTTNKLVSLALELENCQ